MSTTKGKAATPEELAKIIEQQSKQVAKLEAEIDNGRKDRKYKYPEPEKYGGGPKGLRTFLTRCKAYLTFY